MAVPVQNIYYLLCYAWKHFEAQELTDVSAIPGNRVENLLAQVLIEGVARLSRAGLDRDYLSVTEEGRTLRGKLLLSQTVKRTLLPRGQVACVFDELTRDVPHNRALKAALSSLINVPTLDPELRRKLRRLRERLHDVGDVELDQDTLRKVRLHRNIARYSFLMNVCELLARCFVPDSTAGGQRFHAFTEDPQWMGQIFQDFLRSFLEREQHAFAVGAPQVPWHVQAQRRSDLAWLPTMHTDMVLTDEDQRVVVEAKYYATPIQGRFGTRKLISAHLYQLLAYVSQLDATPGSPPLGVLLYAMTVEELHLDYVLGGHRVLVRSLNLDQPWQRIHYDLLAMTAALEVSGAVT